MSVGRGIARNPKREFPKEFRSDFRMPLGGKSYKTIILGKPKLLVKLWAFENSRYHQNNPRSNALLESLVGVGEGPGALCYSGEGHMAPWAAESRGGPNRGVA